MCVCVCVCVCIYCIYSILITWANQRCCVDRLSPRLFITK